MDFGQILRDEVVGFLGIGGVLDLARKGDYSVLATWDGWTRAVAPLVPLLLLIELTVTLARGQFRRDFYPLTFGIYVFNRVVGRFISIGAVAFCIGVVQPLAPFRVSFTWYGLLLGYLVWEFSHFLYHYWAHKVRLLWCLHSTHHAPRAMNLMVSNAHFFLEAPYADVVRTSVCMAAGLEPTLLFAIMFIDGTWGALIHIGERIWPSARVGWFSSLVLTPAHHRVHHARNPLYMDTNFCNLLNIWDRLFGTYQNARADIAIEYGITRQMKPDSFADVYFGEFVALWRDFRAAPGARNKLLYLVMPPGWNHDGRHTTAAAVRSAFLQGQSQYPMGDTVSAPGAMRYEVSSTSASAQARTPSS